AGDAAAAERSGLEPRQDLSQRREPLPPASHGRLDRDVAPAFSNHIPLEIEEGAAVPGRRTVPFELEALAGIDGRVDRVVARQAVIALAAIDVAALDAPVVLRQIGRQRAVRFLVFHEAHVFRAVSAGEFLVVAVQLEVAPAREEERVGMALVEAAIGIASPELVDALAARSALDHA